MFTIHELIKGFGKFLFNENEGVLVVACDENAVSSLCKFKKKLLLLDSLVRVFRQNPELMRICQDAVTLASVPCKDKKELEPRLQKYLDKIIKDIENLDENAQ